VHKDSRRGNFPPDNKHTCIDREAYRGRIFLYKKEHIIITAKSLKISFSANSISERSALSD